MCPASSFGDPRPAETIDDPDAPITADARRIVDEGDAILLEGDASLRYLGREITADRARYDAQQGRVDIDGDLQFLSPGISIRSSRARIDLDDNVFSTGPSDYEIDASGRRATGSAEGIAREADGTVRLEGASYSTCPPGDRSWRLQASELALRPDEGIGTARDIRLYFKGVPLIALPIFSFPIGSERKSGFLAPVLARGTATGLELELPWYWNFRPDIDATFTPRIMTERGLQLKSEFRYLNRQGFWLLDAEYLRDTELDGTRRSFVQLEHTGEFDDDWSSRISAAQVSDRDYFEDLGGGFDVASVTRLERLAEVRYEHDNVQGLARLQSFQTIDEDISLRQRPYRRLPQLALSAISKPSSLGGVVADIETEYVYFDRPASVTGSRVDVMPGLSLPLSGDWWFVEPGASYRFTRYELDNLAEDALVPDSSVERDLPTYSLDAGLFFDRVIDDRGTVQTLEPRLYYLKVPFVDQSGLPNFDSARFDFNISQLFRDNRFTGADRVGDADQLSLALTSRQIGGRDGREQFRGSIGQILYFEDRRVTLPPDDPDASQPDADTNTGDVSDFVGEVSVALGTDWSARGAIQWNPDNEQTAQGSLLASYRPAPSKILNLAYRSVNDVVLAETEQIDFSALWPVGDQWRLAGRWNYSLDADSSIEALLGVEYESCCWALRFAARRFIADDGADHDTGLYLQLVLKGLAPLGQSYGSLLERAILGYRDDYE